MSRVFEFVGEELVNKDGETTKLQSVRGEGKVVGIYFSAHWCPPCRNFTPKLAEFYKKIKETASGDSFEIIFVSSDKSEDGFNEYLSEMPWLAMPFERRSEKGKLSKHFKVSGIPALVLLDGSNGRILNKNGRAIVNSDPEGKNFPWKAKKLHDILKGGEYTNNGGEKKTFETDIKGKILGVYFSAHWCPPCQAFTPLLSKVYDLVNAAEKKFEIIFVTSDQNEEAFKEYFNTMPFLALPFDSEVKNELSEFYDIEGIPMLIIVDEDGEVITPNGRAVVSGDKKGQKFPWIPEPVTELDAVSGDKINEEPCLVYIPGEDEEEFERMKDILEPLGKESQSQAKLEERSPDMHFMVASPEGNDVVKSLCDFIGISPTEKCLFIIDVSSSKIFKSEQQDHSKEVVNQFVKDFREEKLIGKKLRDEED